MAEKAFCDHIFPQCSVLKARQSSNMVSSRLERQMPTDMLRGKVCLMRNHHLSRMCLFARMRLHANTHTPNSLSLNGGQERLDRGPAWGRCHIWKCREAEGNLEMALDGDAAMADRAAGDLAAAGLQDTEQSQDPCSLRPLTSRYASGTQSVSFCLCS